MKKRYWGPASWLLHSAVDPTDKQEGTPIEIVTGGVSGSPPSAGQPVAPAARREGEEKEAHLEAQAAPVQEATTLRSEALQCGAAEGTGIFRQGSPEADTTTLQSNVSTRGLSDDQGRPVASDSRFDASVLEPIESTLASGADTMTVFPNATTAENVEEQSFSTPSYHSAQARLEQPDTARLQEELTTEIGQHQENMPTRGSTVTTSLADPVEDRESLSERDVLDAEAMRAPLVADDRKDAVQKLRENVVAGDISKVRKCSVAQDDCVDGAREGLKSPTRESALNTEFATACSHTSEGNREDSPGTAFNTALCDPPLEEHGDQPSLSATSNDPAGALPGHCRDLECELSCPSLLDVASHSSQVDGQREGDGLAALPGLDMDTTAERVEDEVDNTLDLMLELADKQDFITSLAPTETLAEEAIQRLIDGASDGKRGGAQTEQGEVEIIGATDSCSHVDAVGVAVASDGSACSVHTSLPKPPSESHAHRRQVSSPQAGRPRKRARKMDPTDCVAKSFATGAQPASVSDAIQASAVAGVVEAGPSISSSVVRSASPVEAPTDVPLLTPSVKRAGPLEAGCNTLPCGAAYATTVMPGITAAASNRFEARSANFVHEAPVAAVVRPQIGAASATLLHEGSGSCDASPTIARSRGRKAGPVTVQDALADHGGCVIEVENQGVTVGTRAALPSASRALPPIASALPPVEARARSAVAESKAEVSPRNLQGVTGDEAIVREVISWLLCTVYQRYNLEKMAEVPRLMIKYRHAEVAFLRLALLKYIAGEHASSCQKVPVAEQVAAYTELAYDLHAKFRTNRQHVEFPSEGSAASLVDAFLVHLLDVLDHCRRAGRVGSAKGVKHCRLHEERCDDVNLNAGPSLSSAPVRSMRGPPDRLATIEREMCTVGDGAPAVQSGPSFSMITKWLENYE